MKNMPRLIVLVLTLFVCVPCTASDAFWQRVHALHHAVEAGNLSAVRYALDVLRRSGRNADEHDGHGESALSKAVKRGNLEVVRVLLGAGARVESCVLKSALEWDNMLMFRVLCERMELCPAKEVAANTLLHTAARMGRAGAVQYLLDRGLSMNLINGLKERPLHGAACQGHEPIVDMLLRAGAQVNGADFAGYTALAGAASRGRFAVVSRLLQAGAEIYHQHGDWIVLSRAISSGQVGFGLLDSLAERLHTVQLLVEAGAQLECDAKARRKHSCPLALVARACKLAGAESDQWKEYEGQVMELLLRSGADPTRPCFCHYPLSRWQPFTTISKKSALEVVLSQTDKRKAAIMAQRGVPLPDDAMKQESLKHSAHVYAQAARQWLYSQCPVKDVQGVVLQMLSPRENTEWLALFNT